jgi:hypothetical protein
MTVRQRGSLWCREPVNDGVQSLLRIDLPQHYSYFRKLSLMQRRLRQPREVGLGKLRFSLSPLLLKGSKWSFELIWMTCDRAVSRLFNLFPTVVSLLAAPSERGVWLGQTPLQPGVRWISRFASY